MTETETDRLARRFEDHRTHMLAVAYRMLGSTSVHVPDLTVTRPDDVDPDEVLDAVWAGVEACVR
jgi:hypothetical protein